MTEWTPDLTDQQIKAVAPGVARRVAREEIASLAGLVLRRLQEQHPTRSFERNAADDIVRERLSAIFAEALADFSGHTGGEAPGS